MSDFDDGDDAVGLAGDVGDDDERRTVNASTADARGGVSPLVDVKALTMTDLFGNESEEDDALDDQATPTREGATRARASVSQERTRARARASRPHRFLPSPFFR